MKTKSILFGLAFFAVGMVAAFGIQSNFRHQHYNQQAASIRKVTVIEVGAPLTVKELKCMGLI